MYMYVLHCTTLFEKTHPQNEKLFGRLNAGHSQLFKVIELEDTAHSAVGGGPSAASCSWGIPRNWGILVPSHLFHSPLTSKVWAVVVVFWVMPYSGQHQLET